MLYVKFEYFTDFNYHQHSITYLSCKQQGIVSLNLLIIHVPCHMSHSWANEKTRQNNYWKIREIDWSHLCLQQFDNFFITEGHETQSEQTVI
jgi:hypothetical protein